MEVEYVPIAVLDADKTQESREFVHTFGASNFFQIAYYVDTVTEIENLIHENKVKGGLLLRRGFARQLGENKGIDGQLIIDGSDPTIARTIYSSGSMLSTQYALKGQKKIIALPLDLGIKTQVWFNPNMDSSKFVIPGLIGIIMQNITIMLTAFSLVREKERGTIEQLIVTPLKNLELMLGKMIPYILIGFVDFLIALSFGTWYFRVPIKGSVPLLLLLGLLFVFCALAIGMLISTLVGTQLQAMQITLLFLLPSVLLSGFMFPLEAMPQVIQWVGHILPATYFIKILRGIILKGSSWQYLMGDALALGVLSFALLSFAVLRFRKSLD
jgi:ABC-2 type transport system permease protein